MYTRSSVARLPAAPGAYELTAATAQGFTPFEPLLGHSPVTVWPRAGVRLDDVTIYLSPAAEVLVVVIDDKEQPLGGAEVRAFDDRAGAADAHVAVTDGKGRARIDARSFDVVEARHAGAIRYQYGLQPTISPFDGGYDMAKVLSIAGPLLGK